MSPHYRGCSESCKYHHPYRMATLPKQLHFIACNSSHSIHRLRSPRWLHTSPTFPPLQATNFPHCFIFALSMGAERCNPFDISFCPFALLICLSRSSLPQILPLPIHACILNIDLIFLRAKNHTLSFSLTGGQETRREGRCLESLCSY